MCGLLVWQVRSSGLGEGSDCFPNIRFIDFLVFLPHPLTYQKRNKETLEDA